MPASAVVGGVVVHVIGVIVKCVVGGWMGLPAEYYNTVLKNDVT